MPDGLELLKRSPLARNISDEEIGEQENIFKQKLAEATKPRQISMEDALVSAAIQIAPALIGVAVGGKEGAFHGLQGGAVGGKIYNDMETEDFKRQQQQALAEAQLEQRELDRLQSRQIKLEDMDLSLENQKELADYRAKLDAQRPRGESTTNRLIDLVNGVIFKDKGQGQSTTPQGAPITEGTQATTATGQESQNQTFSGVGASGIAKEIEAGLTREDAEQVGISGIEEVVDLANKGQGYENKKLDADIKRVDIKRKLIDIAQKEKEDDWKKQPFEIGQQFLAIPKDTGLKEKPETVLRLTTDYGEAVDALGKLRDIFNDSTFLQRAATDPDAISAISAHRATLIESLARIRATNTESKGSGNETTIKALDKEIVKIDGIWSNLRTALQSVSPIPGKTQRSELIAQYDKLINSATSRLKGVGLDLITERDLVRKHPEKGWFVLANEETDEWMPLNIGEGQKTLVDKFVKGQNAR